MSQFISLTQYQLIEVQGADVEKYLQGQLTSDCCAISEWRNDAYSSLRPKR